MTAHVGNLRLLDEPLTALFCSNRCPGDLILKTYDLAKAMRDAGVPVVGGFPTPMEKECLRLLLRGTQPVAVCPARGIEGMRVTRDWRPALHAGTVTVYASHQCRQIGGGRQAHLPPPLSMYAPLLALPESGTEHVHIGRCTLDDRLGRH